MPAVVMSSQASSAGRDEAKVRQKLVESGAVDVMIDIRSNFFYTRTVPCQLWFFDRAKERDEARCDHVLMLDARNIHRKVSRAIFDFSREQQKNIAAIVWLYRGQSERFLGLVESYLAQAIAEGEATALPLRAFEEALGKQIDLAEPFATEVRDPDPMVETWEELISARATLFVDINAFAAEVSTWAVGWEQCGNGATRDNPTLHAARQESARYGRTLPGSDQADRFGGEAGWQGRRHRGEGTRRTGLGPMGQHAHQHVAQGA